MRQSHEMQMQMKDELSREDKRERMNPDNGYIESRKFIDDGTSWPIPL